VLLTDHKGFDAVEIHRVLEDCGVSVLRIEELSHFTAASYSALASFRMEMSASRFTGLLHPRVSAKGTEQNNVARQIATGDNQMLAAAFPVIIENQS